MQPPVASYWLYGGDSMTQPLYLIDPVVYEFVDKGLDSF